MSGDQVLECPYFTPITLNLTSVFAFSLFCLYIMVLKIVSSHSAFSITRIVIKLKVTTMLKSWKHTKIYILLKHSSAEKRLAPMHLISLIFISAEVF